MNLFFSEKYKIKECFERMFNKFDADLELADSTRKKYREISVRIIEEIGDIDIRKIDLSVVSKFKKGLNEKGLSPARKNHFIVVLRLLLKFAKEIEKIDVSNYEQIKKYKEINKLVEVLTDEEVKILLDSIDEDNFSKLRLKTLIICLLSTGARISEMLSLNISDVDFESGLASTKGKGGKINQIIFNSLSLEYLKKYFGVRIDDHPALFVTSKSTRWRINCAERAIRNQGHKAGLEKRVYPHLMRKTAASKMFFAGAPLPIVAKFLSHSDLSTCQKYYLRGASFEEVKQYHKDIMDFNNLVSSKE